MISTDRQKKQFQEKMTSLNKGFIKALQQWTESCPHYDLSPSVKSYLQHVKALDDTYANDTATPGNRPIAKARRKFDQSSSETPKTSSGLGAVSSTPFTNAPKFRLSDVSVIAPINTPDRSAAPESASLPSGTSRKRAMRGGGPLGEPETVVFRDQDKAAEPKSNLGATLAGLPSFPKPGPEFWGFGKKAEDTSSSSPAKSAEPKKDEPAKEKPAPALGGFTFNAGAQNGDDTKKDAAPSFPNFFGASAKSTEGPKFPMFGTSAPKTGDAPNDAPKLAFPSFFGSSAPSADGTVKLAFGPSTDAPKADDQDGEEGEYVPPKAEVVENKEPDAFYSIKCAAFKMNKEKKYDKLGVGMFHMKDVDGKKSVLVRAATTVGTVWVNALMNSSMKLAKQDDTKLRIICPTGEGEISIYLFRFSSKTDAEKVLETIEKETK